jgi:hypothetical protein
MTARALVATIRRSLEEARSNESGEDPRSGSNPGPASGKALQIREHPVSLGRLEIPTEILGTLGQLRHDPCRDILPLTAKLLDPGPEGLAHGPHLLARLSRTLVELLTNLEAHIVAEFVSLRRKLLLCARDELRALLLRFCDRPSGTTARLLGRPRPLLSLSPEEVPNERKDKRVRVSLYLLPLA